MFKYRVKVNTNSGHQFIIQFDYCTFEDHKSGRRILCYTSSGQYICDFWACKDDKIVWEELG